jgi:ATP-dependent helicase HrpA
VRGLDTVIIDDTRFTNIIEGGKNVLTRLNLGANEILQMAGRVHGRVEGGRVFILSQRDIEFSSLRPTEPEFQLAGEAERVALTCADIGVRADELDLPVPLDRASYRAALDLLEGRHIIEKGRLTPYGKSVEALPCDRPWAELIVNADDDLIPYLAVMSSIESLHRMTREERDLDGLVVPGSDHLTAYNIYAEAYSEAGYMGQVYGLPRHLFDEKLVERWADRRGVLVKSIEDAALAMASVYRSVGLDLPTEMPNAGERILRRFAELLAQYMPFDLVIDEETAEGGEARVSKTSVCGSWGAIAGELRYFADKMGVARAGIEGTQVPMDLIRRYAHRGAAELSYDPGRRHSPLAMRRRVEYYGFVLEREIEPIEDVFPPELAPQARRALAESVAKFEARHPAVKRNRAAIEEIREAYRRSGGRTPRLGFRELADLYEAQLANVGSLSDFRSARLVVNVDDFVPEAERERLWRLPDAVEIRGREVPIDYDVEDAETAAGEAAPDAANGAAPERRTIGVARLRLPEKLARTLSDAELPSLDRPLRFVVLRGQRGAVRARTLEELQELMDRPWSPDEAADRGATRFDARDRAPDVHLSAAEREVTELARALTGERDRGRGRGDRRGGQRRNGERDVAEDRAERRRGASRPRKPGRPGRNERARARGEGEGETRGRGNGERPAGQAGGPKRGKRRPKVWGGKKRG